jgi:hypothetical protein
MTKFPNLKAGDHVYLCSSSKFIDSKYSAVTKVGREYFYINNDKYRLADGGLVNGYNLTAWPSEAAYTADKLHRDRSDALALQCRNASTFRSLTAEQLEQVAAIVGLAL